MNHSEKELMDIGFKEGQPIGDGLYMFEYDGKMLIFAEDGQDRYRVIKYYKTKLEEILTYKYDKGKE